MPERERKRRRVRRGKAGRRRLAAYDRRAGRIRAALAERGLDEQEVSVFGPANAQFAVFNYVEGFPVTVLNDVGLSIARSQVKAYEANRDAFGGGSLEVLSRLDADFIFFLNDTLESDGEADGKWINNEFKQNALFQRLDAVRNDRVCDVPYNRWNEGSTIAANLLLDDIERCLLEEDR